MSYKWVLGGVTFTAFVIRAAYVMVQTRYAVFQTPFIAGDSQTYLALADAILDGRGLSMNGTPTAFVGPVYPLFLASLAGMGLDTLGVGLVQAVLGAASVLLVGLNVLELARLAGIGIRRGHVLSISGAMAATIYPHMVQWTGYILTETLFLLLMGLTLYLVLVAHRLESWQVALVAGFVAAAAALTRSAFLGLALAVGLLWLLVGVRSHRRLYRVLIVGFFVGLIVPHGAWAARNLGELGAPVVTVTQSGSVLYHGNAAGTSGGTGGYLSSHEIPPLDLPPGLGEVERDRRHLEKALHDISADPGAIVARWPSKLWNMWRPAYADASMRNLVVSLATYLPVLFLGVTGAIALSVYARGPSFTQLPALLILIWVIMHMILVGLIRYRVPAELILLVTTPFGAAAIWDKVRRKAAGGRGFADANPSV